MVSTEREELGPAQNPAKPGPTGNLRGTSDGQTGYLIPLKELSTSNGNSGKTEGGRGKLVHYQLRFSRIVPRACIMYS